MKLALPSRRTKILILVVLVLIIPLAYAFVESDLYFISEIKDFLPPENNIPAYVYGAGVLPNGDIILALPNQVARIDESGNYLTTIGKYGSDEGEYRVPWKVRLDAKGNIYVLDQMGKKIIRFDSHGQFKVEIPFDEASILNFIVTDEGKIIIPDSSRNRLRLMGSDGKYIGDIQLKGNYIVSLARGLNNTILVIESELSGTSLFYFIYRYAIDGMLLGKTRINADINSLYPAVFTESASGHFYIIDSRNGSVFRISNEGKILWKKSKLSIPGSSGALGNMVDLVSDKSGNSLFVADGMHERILKFREYEKIEESADVTFYMKEAGKYEKSDVDRFLCYINLAMLKSPENTEILEKLGHFYQESGNYSKAISTWKIYLKYHPDDAKVKALLGREQVLLYVKRGDRLSGIVRELSREYGSNYAARQYKDAIDSYTKALGISHDPNIKIKIAELKKLYSTGKEEIPEISVEKIKIERNIFSAMYKYYSSNPLGSITVKNTTGHPLDWIKTEVNVKEFMDYPTEGETKKNVPSGEEITLKLFALFNNRILEVTEDTPLGANVKISYSIDNKPYSVTRNISFNLFNRNAMTWDNQKKLASFITPKDPAVKIFARETVQSFRNARFKFLNNALQSAIQIFDTLSVYGITYIPDPKTPFIEYSKNPAMVDFIQYPRDTLRFKTGDCDDLTVLYSSLLQSIGIETATVTIPEHIFMMFNTGVPISNKRSISATSTLLFPYRGKVWIPVETTLLGDSFLEAWKSGAEEIAKYRRKLGIATTSDSWKIYAPVTLRGEKWEPEIPEKEYTEQLYFDDINNLIERELSANVKRIERQLESDPKNPKLYNKLGITYARFGKYRQAERSFKKAIELKADYFSPYNNMGNIYLLQKRYDSAINYYLKALSIDPERASAYINLAFIYKEKNDREKMLQNYERAVSLNERLKEEYSGYFTPGGAEKTGRAASTTKEPELLWDKGY